MAAGLGIPYWSQVGMSRDWCVSSKWSRQCYINTCLYNRQRNTGKTQIKTFVFLHWFVIKLGPQTKEET
jgi:hypothetical protein